MKSSRLRSRMRAPIDDDLPPVIKTTPSLIEPHPTASPPPQPTPDISIFSPLPASTITPAFHAPSSAKKRALRGKLSAPVSPQPLTSAPITNTTIAHSPLVQSTPVIPSKVSSIIPPGVSKTPIIPRKSPQIVENNDVSQLVTQHAHFSSLLARGAPKASVASPPVTLPRVDQQAITKLFNKVNNELSVTSTVCHPSVFSVKPIKLSPYDEFSTHINQILAEAHMSTFYPAQQLKYTNFLTPGIHHNIYAQISEDGGVDVNSDFDSKFQPNNGCVISQGDNHTISKSLTSTLLAGNNQYIGDYGYSENGTDLYSAYMRYTSQSDESTIDDNTSSSYTQTHPILAYINKVYSSLIGLYYSTISNNYWSTINIISEYKGVILKLVAILLKSPQNSSSSASTSRNSTKNLLSILAYYVTFKYQNIHELLYNYIIFFKFIYYLFITTITSITSSSVATQPSYFSALHYFIQDMYYLPHTAKTSLMNHYSTNSSPKKHNDYTLNQQLQFNYSTPESQLSSDQSPSTHQLPNSINTVSEFYEYIFYLIVLNHKIHAINLLLKPPKYIVSSSASSHSYDKKLYNSLQKQCFYLISLILSTAYTNNNTAAVSSSTPQQYNELTNDIILTHYINNKRLNPTKLISLLLLPSESSGASTSTNSEDNNNRLVYYTHLWTQQGFVPNHSISNIFSLLTGNLDSTLFSAIIDVIYKHNIINSHLYNSSDVDYDGLLSDISLLSEKSGGSIGDTVVSVLSAAKKQRFVYNYGWTILSIVLLYHVPELGYNTPKQTANDSLATFCSQYSVYLDLFFPSSQFQQRAGGVNVDQLSLQGLVANNTINSSLLSHEIVHNCFKNNTFIQVLQLFSNIPTLYDVSRSQSFTSAQKVKKNTTKSKKLDEKKMVQIDLAMIWDQFYQISLSSSTILPSLFYIIHEYDDALFSTYDVKQYLPPISNKMLQVHETSISKRHLDIGVNQYENLLEQKDVAVKWSFQQIFLSFFYYTPFNPGNALYTYYQSQFFSPTLLDSVIIIVNNTIHAYKQHLLTFNQWQLACFVLLHNLNNINSVDQAGSALVDTFSHFSQYLSHYNEQYTVKSSQKCEDAYNNDYMDEIWSILVDNINIIPHDNIIDDNTVIAAQEKLHSDRQLCYYYLNILSNLGLSLDQLTFYYFNIKNIEQFILGADITLSDDNDNDELNVTLDKNAVKASLQAIPVITNPDDLSFSPICKKRISSTDDHSTHMNQDDIGDKDDGVITIAATNTTGYHIGMDEITQIHYVLASFFILEFQNYPVIGKDGGIVTKPRQSDIFSPKYISFIVNLINSATALQNGDRDTTYYNQNVVYKNYYNILPPPTAIDVCQNGDLSGQNEAILARAGFGYDDIDTSTDLPQFAHNIAESPPGDLISNHIISLQDQWLSTYCMIPEIVLSLARYIRFLRFTSPQLFSQKDEITPLSDLSLSYYTMLHYMLLLRIEQQYTYYVGINCSESASEVPAGGMGVNSSFFLPAHYFATNDTISPEIARCRVQFSNIYNHHFTSLYNTTNPTKKQFIKAMINQFFYNTPYTATIPLPTLISSNPSLLSVLYDMTEDEDLLFQIESAQQIQKNKAFNPDKRFDCSETKHTIINIPLHNYFTYKYPLYISFLTQYTLQLTPLLMSLHHSPQTEDGYTQCVNYQNTFIYLYCLYYHAIIDTWAQHTQFIDISSFLDDTICKSIIQHQQQRQYASQQHNSSHPAALMAANNIETNNLLTSFNILSNQLISYLNRDTIELIYTYTPYYVLGLIYRYLSLTESIHSLLSTSLVNFCSGVAEASSGGSYAGLLPGSSLQTSLSSLITAVVKRQQLGLGNSMNQRQAFLTLLQNIVIVIDSIDILLADCSIVYNAGKHTGNIHGGDCIVNLIGIAKTIFNLKNTLSPILQLGEDDIE